MITSVLSFNLSSHWPYGQIRKRPDTRPRGKYKEEEEEEEEEETESDLFFIDALLLVYFLNHCMSHIYLYIISITFRVELHALPAVRQLSLAHNRISSIDASALLKSSLLQQLDLDDNLLQKIEGLPETLIHVNLAYNHLTMVPKDITSLPRTVSLNLSHNGIQEISSPISSTDLESLDLSFNKVEVFPTRFIPNALGNIVHLNLEDNRIADLKPFELANYTKLKSLNLASNSLRVLRDDVFAQLHELSSLDLRNNSLDTLEPGVFADLAIGYKLYQFIFNKIPHLHSIDLRHNELQSVGHFVIVSFEEALAQASAVRRLDLSRNRIELLQWEGLPPKLDHLVADNNRISFLGAALKSKLRTVSLRHNRIDKLTSDQVPNTLEIFDVSNNRIHHIGKGTFYGKANLKSLNFTANSLTSIDLECLEVMDGIHPVDVTLKENPLQCTCEMDWIKNSNMVGSHNTSRLIQLRYDENVNTLFFTNNQDTLLVKPKVNVLSIEETKCTHRISKKLITFDQIERKELLCNYSQICEPDCVCCQYGNCDCKAVCPDGCSCYRDALFNSNIVRCENLTGIQMKAFSPSMVPVSATHIFLSGLSLPILRSHSFLGRIRLEQLYINSSGIRNIQPKAFNTLPALKVFIYLFLKF
uniref:LRRCT domain-containing protein n=1 Tax=Heterorhabditis bacteriophora TaxID=37862 RepID=A0A1I7W7L8_HETBA